MKTKYSPEKDDPITSFCNATSEPRESALFFLEGSNWDLDEAVSCFLTDQLLPIIKKPLKPSPSRQKYSVTPSLKSKWSFYTDFETRLDDSKEHVRVLTKDSSLASNNISHEEKLVPKPDPVNCEGSVRAAKIRESTRFIDFDWLLGDHDSDSD